MRLAVLRQQAEVCGVRPSIPGNAFNCSFRVFQNRHLPLSKFARSASYRSNSSALAGVPGGNASIPEIEVSLGTPDGPDILHQ